MKFRLKQAAVAVLAVLSVARMATAQTGDRLPTTDDVVARMMESDATRRAELTGYTAVRRYVAANGKHHAEMLVSVTCAGDGAVDFNVLSEDGSGWIRSHVFRKLLAEEREASRGASHESTRITPVNYQFQIIGEETLDTGLAYVLAVTPKTESKYLVDGKIWVDAGDFSIVRIEGQPARNPSFWVRSTHVVRTYQKVGAFWFASSTDTATSIRILGPAELKIQNSDYVLNPATDRAKDLGAETGLIR